MLNNKKKYLGAEVEVLFFISADVITASSGGDSPYEDPDDGLQDDGWT